MLSVEEQERLEMLITRISAACEFRKLSFGHLVRLTAGSVLERITTEHLTEILTNKNYLNILLTPSDINFIVKALDVQKS
jgi:hypothetical protein